MLTLLERNLISLNEDVLEDRLLNRKALLFFQRFKRLLRKTKYKQLFKRFDIKDFTFNLKEIDRTIKTDNELFVHIYTTEHKASKVYHFKQIELIDNNLIFYNIPLDRKTGVMDFDSINVRLFMREFSKFLNLVRGVGADFHSLDMQFDSEYKAFQNSVLQYAMLKPVSFMGIDIKQIDFQTFYDQVKFDNQLGTYLNELNKKYQRKFTKRFYGFFEYLRTNYIPLFIMDLINKKKFQGLSDYIVEYYLAEKHNGYKVFVQDFTKFQSKLPENKEFKLWFNSNKLKLRILRDSFIQKINKFSDMALLTIKNEKKIETANKIVEYLNGIFGVPVTISTEVKERKPVKSSLERILDISDIEKRIILLFTTSPDGYFTKDKLLADRSIKMAEKKVFEDTLKTMSDKAKYIVQYQGNYSLTSLGMTLLKRFNKVGIHLGDLKGNLETAIRDDKSKKDLKKQEKSKSELDKNLAVLSSVNFKTPESDLLLSATFKLLDTAYRNVLMKDFDNAMAILDRYKTLPANTFAYSGVNDISKTYIEPKKESFKVFLGNSIEDLDSKKLNVYRMQFAGILSHENYGSHSLYDLNSGSKILTFYSEENKFDRLRELNDLLKQTKGIFNKTQFDILQKKWEIEGSKGNQLKAIMEVPVFKDEIKKVKGKELKGITFGSVFIYDKNQDI